MEIWKFVLPFINYYFAFLSFLTSSQSTSPVVKISTGEVQGKILLSRNGRAYNAHLGIPYGKAERFEIAVEHDKWEGVYMATDFGPECIQLNESNLTAIGEENCLFLNVYRPQRQFDDPIPVMIWIHGGGYNMGSSNTFSATYFMDEDVILVTLNYRLGPFGFLCTEDGTVVGNLGLRDQKLALLWVHKNIQKFGGDKSRITLFGSSAGSASVAIHMLTDTAKLFHRAISQSSTALSTWLIQRSPKENAEKLGDLVGCSNGNSKQLIDCLKSKSGAEIVAALPKFNLGTSISKVNFLFTPSVECNSKDAYLKDGPSSIMQQPNFPHAIPSWMVGFTRNDGLLNTAIFLENDELLDELLNNWKIHAPWLLVYQHDADKNERNKISKLIQEEFLLQKNGSRYGSKEYYRKVLPKLVGERWEMFGTIESIRKLADRIPIFPFVFSYPGNYSYANAFHKLENRHGVGHLDELQYLFDGAYEAPSYNDDSEIARFSKNLVALFVKFATTGQPSTPAFPGWHPTDSSKPLRFYDINNHYSDDGNRWIDAEKEYGKSMAFWKSTMKPTCKSCPAHHARVDEL